jgi:CheY-like chemotaxis protein
MTILYADDDDEDQEVFAEIIQAIDPKITILRARNGLDTMEILSKSGRPDIIFLDFNMPFLNGNQVLAEIRKAEKYRDTKVIVFSTLYEQAHDAGGPLEVHYARKPNTIREGMETLRAIIQKWTTE